MKRILLLFFLAAVSAKAAAPEMRITRSYTIEDGLAQAQVTCILEDPRGYLWFGTLGGGVSRFDGKRFENFTQKNGLASNIVFAATLDRAGNLWFGTEGGLSRFNGTNFTNFDAGDGLGANKIHALHEDSQGNLWLGTEGGLVKFDGQTFAAITTRQGLAHNFVQSISEDRFGRLWVGTVQGLSRLQRNVSSTGAEYSIRNFSTSDGLPHNNVRHTLEDRLGNLWICTRGGLARLSLSGTSDDLMFTNFSTRDGLATDITKWLLEDRSGTLWVGSWWGVSRFDGETFTTLTTDQGLSDNIVTSILQDREGNIWVGTWDGVSKLSTSAFSHLTQDDGLAGETVWAIHKDLQGNMWYGTDHGLDRFADGTTTHFGKNDGLASNIVHSIAEDRGGSLWIGTWGGVSRFDGKSFTNFTTADGLSHNAVWSVLPARDGSIWVGTEDGLCQILPPGKDARDPNNAANGGAGVRITHLGREQGLVNNQVRTLFEDRDGDLWIGTWGGVSKYDGHAFTNFTIEDGLSHDVVLAILQDTEGALLFGSYGAGIVRCIPGQNGTLNVVDRFDTEDGLSDDAVVGMAFGDDGDLWVATNKGINKLDMSLYRHTGEKRFKSYSFAEGFTGIENTLNSIYSDGNGDMWFGSIRGATRYNSQADRVNPLAPRVHIVNLRLYSESTDWTHYAESIDCGLPVGLLLPYDQNHLTFDYVGISMTIPEGVKYQFKLHGFDVDWSPTTFDTYATYSNLPQGDYRFDVRAANSDGVWTDTPATFSFEIRPPFWQTLWFRGVSVMTMLSLLIYGSHKIKANERKKTAITEKMADLKLQALSSQMNPHFISNTINSIQYFISCNDQESAFDYLAKFATLMRRTFENSQVARLPIARELECLRLYLELESLRFEDHFKYSIEVHSAIDVEHWEIPAMLIQPYIENAIHHAFPGSSRTGSIKVRLAMEENSLLCMIQDDGIGIEAARRGRGANGAHTSTAMKVTRERLEILKKPRNKRDPVEVIDLTTTDSSASGTLVKIRVPLDMSGKKKNGGKSHD